MPSDDAVAVPALLHTLAMHTMEQKVQVLGTLNELDDHAS